MPRVRALGVDIGARTGLGLLGDPDGVRSGSFQFIEGWYPFGKQALEWERRMDLALDEYPAEHIGLATQFVRKTDTPKNLIPLFWAFGTVLKLAARRGVIVHWINEGEARLAFVGAGNLPNTSDAMKAAVHQGCRDRGWPACDWNASDALCVGAAVVDRLEKNKAHTTSPLFLAAGDTDAA